jgi:hypothetical protein
LTCNVLKIDAFRPDKNMKTISTTTKVWFSSDVPFRLRLTDAEVRRKNLIPEPYAGKFKASQAQVKFELTGDPADGKDTTTLTDFGTDAKATVKLK